jgi:uncharacterized iron-regulated membrane protein
MTLRKRLVHQPQGVWLRRALFQIHLWTGIGVGLYMLMISTTGSAVVFRRELSKVLNPVTMVTPSGPRLTVEQLTEAAKKAFPRLEVQRVVVPKDPNQAVEVWLTRGRGVRERLFDPYTGKDLGDTVSSEHPAVKWLVDLHDDLLGGRKGRLVNGVGASCLTLLCLTGFLIWWPGVSRWKRSLIVRLNTGWKRFNWDLHSALGFWMFLFVFMWGVSGLYLSYPDPFTWLVDFLQPMDPSSTEIRSGDEVLAWLARVHFGRAWGTEVKWLYVILGLVPATLFVTGSIMWWNRVLRPALKTDTLAETTQAASLSPEP